jgi:hypothetical protein
MVLLFAYMVNRAQRTFGASCSNFLVLNDMYGKVVDASDVVRHAKVTESMFTTVAACEGD